MAETPIERSSDRTRFEGIDIRAKVRESQRFWNSPEGKKRAAELEKRKLESIRRNRGKTKFPALAKRGGTKPAIGPLAEVADMKARLGI